MPANIGNAIKKLKQIKNIVDIVLPILFFTLIPIFFVLVEDTILAISYFSSFLKVPFMINCATLMTKAMDKSTNPTADA
jgi:hypothetical protein